jgi:hypothetical protein
MSVRAGTSIPVLINVPSASPLTMPALAATPARFQFLLFYRISENQARLQYRTPALQDNGPGDEEPKRGVIKHLVRTNDDWLAINDTPVGDRRQQYRVVLREQDSPTLAAGLVADLAMTPAVVVTGFVGQMALGLFYHGQLTRVEQQVSMWEKPTAAIVCKNELSQLWKESSGHVAQCGDLTVGWSPNIAKSQPDQLHGGRSRIRIENIRDGCSGNRKRRWAGV